MKWYWSKYPKWVRTLVILAGIIGISMAIWDGYKGCNRVNASSQKNEPTPDDNRKAITRTNNDVLKIKGFYLGMSIDDAVGLANSQYANLIGARLYVQHALTVNLPEDDKVATEPNAKFLSGMAEKMKDSLNPNEAAYIVSSGTTEEDALTDTGLTGLGGLPINIEANSDKKVIRIFFSGELSDKLFNSTDMDTETFIENFKKGYGITNFKMVVAEEKNPFMDSSVSMPKMTWEYSSPAGYKIIIGADKSIDIKSIPKPTERGFD